MLLNRFVMATGIGLVLAFIQVFVKIIEAYHTTLFSCRFSSDLYTVDDQLPFTMNGLLAKCFMLTGIALVLCFVQVTTLHIQTWYFFMFFEIRQLFKRIHSFEVTMHYAMHNASRTVLYATMSCCT